MRNGLGRPSQAVRPRDYLWVQSNRLGLTKSIRIRSAGQGMRYHPVGYVSDACVCRGGVDRLMLIYPDDGRQHRDTMFELPPAAHGRATVQIAFVDVQREGLPISKVQFG